MLALHYAGEANIGGKLINANENVSLDRLPRNNIKMPLRITLRLTQWAEDSIVELSVCDLEASLLHEPPPPSMREHSDMYLTAHERERDVGGAFPVPVVVIVHFRSNPWTVLCAQDAQQEVSPGSQPGYPFLCHGFVLPS